MQVNVNSPCTVYVKFKNGNPNLFRLWHDKHGLYYFRELQGKTNRIKFNLCHKGKYDSDTDFDIIKIVPIEIPDRLPDLPAYERDEIKDFVITDNPDLNAPARIFAKKGVVEKGNQLNSYPKPIRVFILLHEIGHFFYGLTNDDIKKANTMSDPDGRDYLKYKRNESEKKCDLFALVHYLKMGYNRTMAFYALAKVLSRSQDNIDRVKQLLKNIQKTQDATITTS